MSDVGTRMWRTLVRVSRLPSAGHIGVILPAWDSDAEFIIETPAVLLTAAVGDRCTAWANTGAGCASDIRIERVGK